MQRDGKVKFGALCRGCPLCHFSRSAPGRLGLQPLDLLVDQRNRGRNVIERAFNQSKQWGALATRYDCEDAGVTPGRV